MVRKGPARKGPLRSVSEMNVERLRFNLNAIILDCGAVSCCNNFRKGIGNQESQTIRTLIGTRNQLKIGGNQSRRRIETMKRTGAPLDGYEYKARLTYET